MPHGTKPHLHAGAPGILWELNMLVDVENFPSPTSCLICGVGEAPPNQAAADRERWQHGAANRKSTWVGPS